jgi:hypothetical protein
MQRRIFTLRMLAWIPASRPYCVGCGVRFTPSEDTRCRYDKEHECLFVYCFECGAALPLYDPRPRRKRSLSNRTHQLLTEVHQNSSNFKP